MNASLIVPLEHHTFILSAMTMEGVPFARERYLAQTSTGPDGTTDSQTSFSQNQIDSPELDA